MSYLGERLGKMSQERQRYFLLNLPTHLDAVGNDDKAISRLLKLHGHGFPQKR